MLFFTAAVIFAYMLFFADSGERAVVQALLMGTVVAVIVSTLLLLQFLNNPFHDGVGGLRPDAMERTLKIIDEELSANEHRMQLPCDARGNARSSERPVLTRWKNPDSRSCTTESIGCPLTIRGPSHGALSANKSAKLNAITTARPTINSEVRKLARKVNAPAFTIRATPLAASVIVEQRKLS